MTAYVAHTTVDSSDPFALSEWWKAVLGYEDLPDDPNLPEHDEAMIVDPATGHRLLFLRVHDAVESKARAGKNRLHLDLRPRSGGRDEELGVLLAHGARMVADHRSIHGPGTGWIVLADPEGNEFCLLRSAGEAGLAV